MTKWPTFRYILCFNLNPIAYAQEIFGWCFFFTSFHLLPCNNCSNERIANVIPDSASEFIQVNKRRITIIRRPWCMFEYECCTVHTELCKIVPISFFFSSYSTCAFRGRFYYHLQWIVHTATLRLTTSFRYSYNFCCGIQCCPIFPCTIVFLKFANSCIQILH